MQIQPNLPHLYYFVLSDRGVEVKYLTATAFVENSALIRGLESKGMKIVARLEENYFHWISGTFHDGYLFRG